MLPIMLQLYNLRDELAVDFEGTLQKIAALGYRYVELAGLYGKSPKEFKAGLLTAGLTAVSAHVPYRDMLADPENVMDRYIEIGCKYIVIPYLIEADRCTSPNYEGVKKEIAKLGELAKKQGAILLYHNHEFEFQSYHGKYALDDLYDSIPADLLQTEIDTCWANIGGVDPGEYILKYRGRSPVVHLKDFYLPEGLSPENMYELIGQAKQAGPNAKGGFEFRAVGYGRQDIPAILKAAEEAGASWVVVEQDLPTPGKTPLECAKDSIDYLKGLQ
ncbi:sugar phosphate isomerase/epimerase [Treponema sp. TIM-1]|uniref:sugar phosphate isomerase/epimerase family protein n=1 Tax=Treponema sp. TIM-1 TaxID=2898417 RepID=UPI0039802BCF